MASTDIGALLAQLVSSPRMQVMGKQLRGTANQFGAGPLKYPGAISGMGSRSGGGSSGGYKAPGASIGGIIGKLGGSLVNQQQQQQPVDPLMQMYAQLLEQLQQPVDMPTGVNTEDLMRQVQDAINPIYDARAENARNQTDRGTAQVQDMYRALSNDYERLAPEAAAQAEANKAEIESMYGQLRSNIEGNYARVSKDQSELFQRLGIEDALPSVLAEQQAPVQDALIAASENQTQQEQRYMDIGDMDQTYMREGSPLATMTGNEISTDMLADLSDMLNQIEGERSSGIQSAYMDQYNTAQNNLLQQQQMAQGQGNRNQEMLFSLLQSQLGGGQQQELTPDSFMGSLPPQVQQQVAGAYTQLQRSPEAVYGKVQDPRNPVPGTFVETTPQWYMQQADAMLKNGQIDSSTHQALLMYIQLAMGVNGG